MGPVSKGPSGRNLSSEEMEKLLQQFQEKAKSKKSSSPVGMSGRGLSSFDLGASPRIGMGGGLGSSYGMGVPIHSRSRSWIWWIAGIVVATTLIAGIWFLIRRFV
jgi:hypothetical protein